MRRSTSITSPGSGRSSLTPGILAAVAAVTLLLLAATELDAGFGISRSLAVALPALALGLAAATACRPSRAATFLVAAGAILAGPIRGLFYDPARDAGCPLCLPSPIAVLPNLSLAKGLALLGGCLVLAGLGVAAVGLKSLFATVAAIAAAASVTAYDSPRGLRLTAVWVTVALAAVAVSVALGRVAIALSAVARLTDDLRSGWSPDVVLRTHLADPSARVEFVVPSPGPSTLWVTAGGAAVDELSTTGSRPVHTTMIHSRGKQVARLHHSRTPVTVTPELALVLEQAGLAAGLAHQVSELEESRTRIVQLADSERRQLERDLHDGAQQYLLALALELSLTPPELEGALDVDSRDALRQCRADAEAALNELRAVAQGTYPVLLESGGLRPALQELGRRSGAAVIVHDAGPTVLPPAAAAALCGLVEELAASGCTPLTVDVTAAEPSVVQVTGGTPAHESLNLERLAASGAMVEVMPDRTVVRFS